MVKSPSVKILSRALRLVACSLQPDYAEHGLIRGAGRAPQPSPKENLQNLAENMFPRRKVSPQEITELRLAAVRLFGLEQAASCEFWQTLSLAKVKSAFREKARRYHPDLNRQARPDALQANTALFIAVRNSYEVLKRFLGADVFKPFG
jgi:hypothetical protein